MKKVEWMHQGVKLNKRMLLPVVLLILGSLCGCSIQKLSTEKTNDLDYTVLAKEEIPEEFAQRVEAAKTRELQMSYEEDGWMYLARGYGEQKAGGYRITVQECYETETNVVLHTEFHGPEESEEGGENMEYTTCPYLVVKLESRGKDVVFQ